MLASQTIRINPVVLMAIFVPSLALLRPWDYSLKPFFSKPYQILEDGSYRICLEKRCVTYGPEELSTGVDTGVTTFYFQTDLKQAQAALSRQRIDLVWDLILFMFAILVLVSIYLFNKIQVRNDTIVVKIGTTDIFNHWVGAKYAIIQLSKIQTISIRTMTPLVPDRNRLDQLNWRDQVTLHYIDDSQQLQSVMVPLFVFPGFRRVVVAVQKLYPHIPIQYSKNTLTDNVKEYPPL